MINQPDYGEVSFISGDSKNIELLNKALGDIKLTEGEEKSLVWLSGWESSTVKNIISAFKKAKINL